MSIINLIRPDILSSQNYTAGGEGSQLRLHANELPWSPVESLGLNHNFYPDPHLQKQLQDQLILRYQIDQDQIVITRGSDDGIDLITRLFLNAGKDALLQFPPTFPMYSFYVRIQQAELLQCPLDSQDNFSLSMDKINNSWQPNCKVILFCSPNNPTGNLIGLDLIAATCEYYANQSVVVVDEAYIEFSNSQSAVSLIERYENLIVLRTLSKAYGLAGLRLGCIIAQPHIIQAFNKIIAPFTLPGPVMALAIEALNRDEWFTSAIKRIQNSRNWLFNELQKITIFEKVYPSESNFIFVKTAYAQELTLYCSNKGIAIRNFPPHLLLHDHLRITVGDETQNQMLMETLSSFTQNIPGLNYAKDLIY